VPQSLWLPRIPRNTLTLGRVLGTGEYGVVQLATYNGAEVAVKTLKAGQAGAKVGVLASTCTA
jgi:hypothetical protein